MWRLAEPNGKTRPISHVSPLTTCVVGARFLSVKTNTKPKPFIRLVVEEQ
jgi:hypothetical protein